MAVGWAQDSPSYIRSIRVLGLPAEQAQRLKADLHLKGVSPVRLRWWMMRPFPCRTATPPKWCRIWGDPPPPYRPEAFDRVLEGVREWLVYHGYFSPLIFVRHRLNGVERIITLDIRPGRRAVVRAVVPRVADSVLLPYVQSFLQRRPLQGQPFEVEALDEWRRSLATYLDSLGFWGFSPQHIRWRVDTVGGAPLLFLMISDSVHYRAVLDSVVLQVHPYRPLSDSAVFRSLRFPRTLVRIASGTVHPSALHFYVEQPEGHWSRTAFETMVRRLEYVSAFQLVQHRWEPYWVDSVHRRRHFVAMVDAFAAPRFHLSPAFELHLAEEQTAPDLTQGRFYGVGGGLNFVHRNLWRRLVQWNTRLEVAFESALQRRQRLVSNTRVELSSGLLLDRALFFGRLGPAFHAAQEQTVMELSHSQELNAAYQRVGYSGRLVYRFINPHNRHTLTPLFISYSFIHILDPELQRIIDESPDPFLREIFRSHVIPLFRYSFFYTDLTRPRRRWNVVLYWTPLESAGNLAYWLNRRLSSDTPPYTIGGIPFYQYVRTNMDVRLHRFMRGMSFNIRWWGGVAVPYGNQRYLPFEARYYIGGSNSLRGWRYQEIGPGGVDDTTISPFQRAGEMILLASAEIRWTYKGPWKGALFVDAGNVWNVSNDYGYPASVFRWDQFVSQLAVGGGTGLRYDFDYFLLRVDGAVPLYDPISASFTPPQWNWTWLKDNFRLHLGVGYPF